MNLSIVDESFEKKIVLFVNEQYFDPPVPLKHNHHIFIFLSQKDG